MSWSKSDLEKLKLKGFKIDGEKPPDKLKKPAIKIEKISTEKRTIQIWLDEFKKQGSIDGYVLEHRFDKKRRFRFDWAIPTLMIAIEYEGIFSDKSRHLTVSGYSRDCIKYNLAILRGWRVLRYTSDNYKNLSEDLKTIINEQSEQKIQANDGLSR